MKKILNKNKLIIKLNDERYSYDVYQMFNIYYQNLKIEFHEENYEYEVIINNHGISIINEEQLWEYNISEDDNFKEEIRKGIFSYLKDKTRKVFPWGTLIGIRPSKRAMSLIKEGKSYDDIVEFYHKTSLTSEEKAKLCIEVAENELELMDEDKNKISVYIGMPYCPSKCLYCSFTSNPIGRKGKEVNEYIRTLLWEMKVTSEEIKRLNLTIDTVYFGGGTPTAVNDEQFRVVMKSIQDNFITNFDIREFTVECGRPDSITYDKLLCMKEMSVNRISINPQTMNDLTLKSIGRTHDSKDVINIFNMARELGHENINMDIIIGLPGEGLNEVKRTCEEIERLSPESITVHGLSIKRGSKLYEKLVVEKSLYIPEQHEIVEMFKQVEELSLRMNMKPYYMYRQKNMLGNMENIGYSIKGRECVYNIAMIEDTQTIIAVGANGISKFLFDNDIIERLANNKDVRTYIDKVEEITEEKVKMLRKV
ncbi:coproporphyrinogen III oxidase [Oceanirhabdus sp. W0125-5]|uniref:coproporphyrinogen III oxidase n=1 Tax=Oceanirhabdus sp. W0125-5 TaxID=2999116 RepID=UPI0022F2CCC5|nr:coproporphyrinogen III oxidase [Oceanirhabdus sp. W0125-5]WBW99540.1 coproporphyrinogen III oxidase [Oceanirhabdus sp. W0125-5]